ncbi:MAG: FAD/NAD(P)-binding protein [bacterium]
MCTREMQSLYKPFLCRIEFIEDLTPLEKLFKIEIPTGVDFHHQPGQFVQVSVWGFGEAPISISSSPTRKGYIELGVRNAGSLTNALHQLKPGDKIGVRGPFGSCFDVQQLRHKDLLLIAGGCGLAPLRSLIQYCEDRREEFGDIRILYGAKTPEDMLYKSELAVWERSEIFECHTTVDSAGQDTAYAGNVGLIPALIPCLEINSQNTVAVIIGPQVMYKFVIDELKKKGLLENHIIVSLERHMKCGVGKCGHCTIEHLYCCIDGPVFNLTQVQGLKGAL